MDKYISCIVHNASDGNLLIGDKYSALIDCGMAFCAEETIQKVKDSLKGKPLDYIILTHTHYDHIGALPFFRKEWPALQTVTSDVGAAILLKDTPRRVIRELSLVAAEKYGVLIDTAYSDDVFSGDIIVQDGGSISLGGLTVDVVETPGHTRDSLSFFIPELEMFVLSETPGVLLPDGSMQPGYLSSYTDTISSIAKCRKIPHRYLSLPHCGIVNDKDADGFFDKALAATAAYRDFIIKMKEKGLNEDEMQNSLFQRYASDILLSYQPKEAFMTNARARIASTLRDIRKD